MAIALSTELSKEKIIEFPEVEFDEENSSFILKSKDKENIFSVDYIPHLDKEFEDKEFKIFFFSNQYLNAENDVFEVHEKELERIGWIFPIQVLESNENDFSDNEFLNKYKYPVFKKLLKGSNKKRPSFTGYSNYRLTDFYNDDIIVFVISLETIPEEYGIDILNYLPCFANFGYYPWNTDHHQYFMQQSTLALKKRGSKKIKIQKSKLDISQNQFLKDLYRVHLKSINHFLLKFYFLYQVIEYLMEENFDTDFTSLVEEYKNSRLSKNDLKEKINSITRERGSISSLFEKAKVSDSIQVDFKRDCKALLETYYPKTPENLGDLIYDTRNLVVHRYREILKKEEDIDLLDLVTHELEIIINELIITYSPQQWV
jgi:hypothetical protein